MNNYDHKNIEKKWQDFWEKEKINKIDLDKAKNPFYNLMMFPYPSAEGLHVGNMYAFVHSDAYGRFMRLQGYDVFEPIGLDGFGIHSENYAIKIKEHIRDVSERTEKNFYKQLHMIGNMYDWERTVETYKPNYYKWTQWLFLKMYEKGLAVRKKSMVNWCPSCKTVLSDEQIINDQCERCDSVTEKKEMEQWFWKITDYAERLLKNLECLPNDEKGIDWTEEVKTIQKNWIGKSEGSIIKFRVIASEAKQSPSRNEIAASSACWRTPRNDEYLEVFTTRLDTIFGCTYCVVAPEHELVASLLKLKTRNSKLETINQNLKVENAEEIREYVEKAKKKSEIARTDEKNKTGVEIKGIKAINPFTGEKVPIYVADYVLSGYGTGAVMAVPAHDTRDWEFAKKYKLPIKEVIIHNDNKTQNSKRKTQNCNSKVKSEEKIFTDDGILTCSKKYNGLTSKEAREKMTAWLEKNKLGSKKINYKLRDWCVSRQRYWGPPIPMVNCSKCGWVPVPEKDLPVELPDMDDFLPDGTGKGPLNKVDSFVNTTCPKCGEVAKRETDVSDPFVDSSWYYMRYLSTELDKKPFSEERMAKWMPVNMYIGGKEHSVLHLLYSRFVTMVMHELGYAPKEEPFEKFRAHGLLIKDGAKISKSKGNIINPDEYIEKYGADTVRLYLMFLGDMRLGGDWRDDGIAGMHRFVQRLWKTQEKIADGDKLGNLLHKSIKKIGEDINNLKYNTAISKIMILVNKIYEVGCSKGELEKILIMTAPFAPHIAEEMYSQISTNLEQINTDKQIKTVFNIRWPEFDAQKTQDEEIELVVQINGKVRSRIITSPEISEEEAKELALKDEKVKNHIAEKEIRKIIFVKGKLVNIVIT